MASGWIHVTSIDLSILGAEPGVFDAFEAAIRAEYAHVDAGSYRAGRGAVLASFLEKPVIYACPALGERLEARARENLRRASYELARS